MKCPRCKHEHKELINGRLVSRIVTDCPMCNFPIVSEKDKNFANYCAINAQEHINDFINRGEKTSLTKADAYLKVVLMEIEKDDDIDLIRPEVSG